MFSWRLKLGAHGWYIAKLPNINGRADRQPAVTEGEAHRLVERAKVRVDHPSVGPHEHQLSRLIRRHRQRTAKLVEYCGKIGRVNAAQRRRALVFVRGVVL